MLLTNDGYNLSRIEFFRQNLTRVFDTGWHAGDPHHFILKCTAQNGSILGAIQQSCNKKNTRLRRVSS